MHRAGLICTPMYQWASIGILNQSNIHIILNLISYGRKHTCSMLSIQVQIISALIFASQNGKLTIICVKYPFNILEASIKYIMVT